MAFMNNLPYLEIRTQDIQRLASNDAQRLFYQVIINSNLFTKKLSILTNNANTKYSLVVIG